MQTKKVYLFYEKGIEKKSRTFNIELIKFVGLFSSCAKAIEPEDMPNAIFIKGYSMWLGYPDNTAGIAAKGGQDFLDSLYDSTLRRTEKTARDKAKKSVLLSRLLEYPTAIDLYKDLEEELSALKEKNLAAGKKSKEVKDATYLEIEVGTKYDDESIKIFKEGLLNLAIVERETKEGNFAITPLSAHDVYGVPGEREAGTQKEKDEQIEKYERFINYATPLKKTYILENPQKLYFPSLKGFEHALMPYDNFKEIKNKEAFILPKAYQLSFDGEGEVVIKKKDMRESRPSNTKHLDPLILSLIYSAFLTRTIAYYEKHEEYDFEALKNPYIINLNALAKLYTGLNNPGESNISSVLSKLKAYEGEQGALTSLANPEEIIGYGVLFIEKYTSGNQIEIRSPYIAELIKRQLIKSDKEAKAALEERLIELTEQNANRDEKIEALESIISDLPPLHKKRKPYFTDIVKKLNFRSQAGAAIFLEMIQTIEKGSKSYEKNTKRETYTPHVTAKTLFFNNTALKYIYAESPNPSQAIQRAFKAALTYLNDHKQFLEERFKDIKLPEVAPENIPNNLVEASKILYTFPNLGRYNKEKLESSLNDYVKREAKKRAEDEALQKTITEEKQKLQDDENDSFYN